ncbi:MULTISPECIES: flagellar basal body-associated protein FliL [unclassified Duganella]|jgi:flagellar FliL protein|uniref:flagellar basal body-associated protein FliL n=1 Tax=unclassified Duganella TaxID=2636909 RepID=UPI000882085D|nr:MULTISPECIES: flagellar basal body-associated protein FliL [unclassified Duganella]SDG02790.1 flagellar FliL protein [Duganella sp. OV458]SDJ02515.1 flagellar FliL protein [Duganella sp. OV510]
MKADQKVEAPAGGGSKKLIIIIVVLVLLLGGGGAGAAWFLMHGKADAEEHDDSPKKKKAKKAAVKPEYVPVEPFTVNLQPGEDGADQYLQIAFTLQVGGVEEMANVKDNMAKVRSRMLLLLSSKRAAEINTPEGKIQLAKDIVTQLREPFEDRGSQQDIEDVLFTSFIIQ